MGNERVKQAMELLEQGVSDVFTSGRYQEYLEVMSRFHSYSARNCMLILMQRPDATMVAGYRKWQKDFNRQVRKGEKSIGILAPVPHKAVIRETDKDTGEVTDHEHVWNSFKVVSVFDISQTDGDDLPTLSKRLSKDVDGFETLVAKIKNVSAVPIEITDIDGSENGFYSLAESRIVVRSGMSEAQTIKTMVHEVAHSMLHCSGGDEEDADGPKREVQAESVAFVVCNSLGIDTGEYSFGYVAGWEKGNDLAESLDAIQKTAHKIIDGILG